LERLRFGPRRTLNVREAGLSGAEAMRRVDGWLRSKQVEFSGDVLIITGRGAGSRGGVAVVREATLRLLQSLKRSGVIASIAEDTPGSFVVTLAPLRALLEAPARRKAQATPARSASIALNGLTPATVGMIEELAARSLASLGVISPSPALVRDEMARQFSVLARSAPSGPFVEEWLLQAVTKALSEYGESH
jgi:hypothetical protein